jgi:hypothetical protein
MLRELATASRVRCGGVPICTLMSYPSYKLKECELRK